MLPLPIPKPPTKQLSATEKNLERISYDYLKESDLYQRKYSGLTEGGGGTIKLRNKDETSVFKNPLQPLPEANR